MKKMEKLLLALLFYSINNQAQNVGIGTNSPNPKAALEIKSFDKGSFIF